MSKTNNNVLMNYMFHWKSFSKIFIFLSLFLSNFHQFLSKSPTDNSHKSRRKFIKTNRYWFLVNKKQITNHYFGNFLWKASGKIIAMLSCFQERCILGRKRQSVNQTIARFSLRFSFSLSILFKNGRTKFSTYVPYFR